MSQREALLEAALQVRKHAYCPYSEYPVAAAILSESGRIYVGVNVENASFGGTICAERMAIGALIAAGDRQVVEVLVITADAGTPCGLCRQALVEFATEDAVVHCTDPLGAGQTFELRALIPHAFHSDRLGKK